MYQHILVPVDGSPTSDLALILDGIGSVHSAG
jgi:nucleotide-binding universal stress UspA family protein